MIIYKNKKYRILKKGEIIKEKDLIYDSIGAVPVDASIGMTVKETHAVWIASGWKFIRKYKKPYKRIIKNICKKK